MGPVGQRRKARVRGDAGRPGRERARGRWAAWAEGGGHACGSLAEGACGLGRARSLGRASLAWVGPCGGGKELGPGEGKRVCGLGWCGFWVAMGLGLSFVLGFLSISPFLFLIQTITQLGEFKFKFEFTTSTQTNKLMHQHECNNSIKPKENFYYLCNKIRLNALLAQ